MLKTRAEKILLGLIILAIILIPTGSFLLAQRFKAQEQGGGGGNRSFNLSSITAPLEVPKDSPIKELQKNLTQVVEGQKEEEKEEPIPSLPVSVGPTLSFRANLEGRGNNNQAAKMFVGLASGVPANNPTYLLTFNVNVPKDGVYTGLSLAGLNTGLSYTAYLKGAGQIATASAFTMMPNVTDLGIVNLLSGDLNEDNVIDALDYAIVKAALGTTPNSAGWNGVVDLNGDNIVNSVDLAIVNKNKGKIGASGAWYSKSPVASPSGGFIAPAGGKGGYWMWVPQ